MERKLYQPTEKQLRLPANGDITVPSDEELKAIAKKSRKPWGLVKRDFVANNMKRTRDYAIGLWQGRVDAARGCEYTEERLSEAYNYGYHEGYTMYKATGQSGWDSVARERINQYLDKED